MDTAVSLPDYAEIRTAASLTMNAESGRLAAVSVLGQIQSFSVSVSICVTRSTHYYICSLNVSMNQTILWDQLWQKMTRYWDTCGKNALKAAGQKITLTGCIVKKMSSALSTYVNTK